MPNTHLADATMRLEPEDRAPSSDDVARAAAEGTLALAYEQRTANLVAFLTLAAREGWALDADARTMRTQIVEALDLATVAELIDGTYKTPAERHEEIIGRAVGAERNRITGALMSNSKALGWDTDEMGLLAIIKPLIFGADDA
ncbi:hypothetical protein SEA_ABBA_57 [Arthrobacter phage Abba]|uniref:Uncharacterized protein n=1 Tax=Arthrobacter phage Abba TaxID=2713256 RepID=A0A6G8R2I1_9CAUD|nr:hypothetical protein HYQ28_gp57 [Arthrobacter phage Abba]QIN94386.1 hypothetical protein SEA_ABBA_57 [Arthrobacter phage Abba]